MTNKTAKLRKEITSTISAIIPCYYSQAQDDHPTNYAVYTLEEIQTLDDKTQFELEVNVMGYGTNTATVEEKADLIQAAFDHQSFLTSDIFFDTYQEKRQTITEEDRNVIRRRLTFELNFYGRN